MSSSVKPNCSQGLVSGSAPRGTHSDTFWLLPGDCNDEVVCGLEPRVFSGLPRWLSSKESAYQCKRHEFDPWVRKIPWSRKWQPIPLFLPGKSHGQSLVSYTPMGHKESDMAEQLSTAHTHSKYTPDVK